MLPEGDNVALQLLRIFCATVALAWDWLNLHIMVWQLFLTFGMQVLRYLFDSVLGAKSAIARIVSEVIGTSKSEETSAVPSNQVWEVLPQAGSSDQGVVEPGFRTSRTWILMRNGRRIAMIRLHR